jgi:hypothetical protein
MLLGRLRLATSLAGFFLLHFSAVAWPQGKLPGVSWKFAVSGDSRNCGDVVMPTIADNALKQKVEFYWHLGDFGKMSGVDEEQERLRHSVGLLD